MTNLTNRQIQAVNTKNKIYSAAIKSFINKGFNNVRIKDITDIAGVSKGTFYTHFDSKESIIYEYFDRIDNYYSNIYNSEIKKLEKASDQLALLTNAVTHFSSEVCGLEFLKIIYSNQLIEKNEQKLLINSKRTYYQIIKSILKKGIENGEFFITDLNQLTLLYCRYIHGMLYDWCLYEGNFSLIEEGNKTFVLFLKSII